MQQKSGGEARLNAYGELDVDYYIAQARRLRSETLSEMLRELVCRVKRYFRIECSSPMREVFIK